MPRKKINTEMLKGTGAIVDAKQNGASVDLYLDPSKFGGQAKKTIAAIGEMKSLDRAMAGQQQFSAPVLPTFYEGAGKSANMPVHEKIKLAMMYFHADPMVGKIIEIMKVFASDGFKNQCDDPKIKEWYDEWCDKVDIELVLDWIFLEYFRTGNVITYREYVPYTPKLLKATAALDAADAARKKDWSKAQIPMAYTVINPLYVKVVEGENNGWKDKLYGDDNIIQDGFAKDDLSNIHIGQPMSDQLRSIIKSNRTNVALSDKQYQRILRMRQPYESYGCVIMERAFNALYEKNKMRQNDLDSMNSSITQLIKVTVGDKDYPATQRQVRAVSNAFQNVGKSQMIFWNHTLQVEAIQTHAGMTDDKKYERVDQDIRNAFGMSEILLGGGGQKVNFASSYLSLKAFITNLIDARRSVKRWLEGQYREIADVAGFKEIPDVVFSPLTLTDEIAEKQIIMQLVDRGIISYETAQSELGFDPDVEQARRTKQMPLIEAGIYGPIGSPYTQANADGIANGQDTQKQDKQNPQTMDQNTQQNNKANNKASDPSKPIPAKTDPTVSKNGGRPSGKGPGKKMPNRKSSSKASLVDPMLEFKKDEEEIEDDSK